jgi:internalin A
MRHQVTLVLFGSKIRFIMTGIAIIALSQLLLWNMASIGSASPQRTKPKSFAQWCSQKESVSAGARHTIDVLLKETGSKNCKKADRLLKNLTELDLYKKKISDLEPLAGLTNLTSINLFENQISDIKPLASLTKRGAEND